MTTAETARGGRLFGRILVPLDGSAAAESVVARVAPLREPGSALHLIRVVSGSESPSSSSRLALELLEAESYLSYMAACDGEGSEFEVRRGDAAEAILDAAAALRPDLIALAPRARPRDGQGSVGSTAGRLILQAACPVYVAGAEGVSPARPPVRLLVPLDGSAAAEAALDPARTVARATGATVIMLRVIEPLWAAGDSTLATQQEREVRAARDRCGVLVEDLRREGIAAHPLFVGGDPTGTIRAQVERRGIDLVCLATAPRGPVGRLVFGSVAQKLIGTLPVPVIAVRRAA